MKIIYIFAQRSGIESVRYVESTKTSYHVVYFFTRDNHVVSGSAETLVRVTELLLFSGAFAGRYGGKLLALFGYLFIFFLTDV